MKAKCFLHALFLCFCSQLVACGTMVPSEEGFETKKSQLLGEPVFENDSARWTQAQKSLVKESFRYGRSAAVSQAFATCLTKAMTSGLHGVGPYYHCKGDPHAGLTDTQRVLKVLAATRTHHSVRMSLEYNGSGLAHHHGGGDYGDSDEYFDWSRWLMNVTKQLTQKLCKDSAFCLANPGHTKCSTVYQRSHNGDTPDTQRCRYEAAPWPYTQVAGVAWHEVMHHHTYSHGSNESDTSREACDIDPRVKSWHYQKNTVPYIVGKCMEIVLYQSANTCAGGLDAPDGRVQIVKDLDSNQCIPIADPKREQNLASQRKFPVLSNQQYSYRQHSYRRQDAANHGISHVRLIRRETRIDTPKQKFSCAGWWQGLHGSCFSHTESLPQ